MILIIEDNEDNQAITEKVLTSTVPAVKRRFARTAAEAIETLRDEVVLGGVRLILLDMVLGGRSGLELLKELNSHSEMAGVPVVVVADQCPDEEIRRAYQLGARSVLIKPGTFEEHSEMLRVACVYWLSMNLSTNDARVKRPAI